MPSDIESLSVIKDESVLLFGGNPMHRNVYVSIIIKDGGLNLLAYQYYDKHVIEKFSLGKEFYAPQYDTESKRRSVLPDLRKTIHWDPDLKIEENGKATVEFFNGDRYTKIKCILEGITDDGVPVHAEHYYNVSLQRDDQ